MTAADALQERLIRGGWVPPLRRGLEGQYWTNPRHPGMVVFLPDDNEFTDVAGICAQENRFLDEIELKDVPKALQLAAPDLLVTLKATVAALECAEDLFRANDSPNFADYFAGVIQHAGAAITKAEGETQ